MRTNMEKPKFEFEIDFNTQRTVLFMLGRFVLADGSIARLIFTPEGLKLAIPFDCKSIIHLPSDNSVSFTGLTPYGEADGEK
jgi:hypothetical protein